MVSNINLHPYNEVEQGTRTMGDADARYDDSVSWLWREEYVLRERAIHNWGEGRASQRTCRGGGRCKLDPDLKAPTRCFKV